MPAFWREVSVAVVSSLISSFICWSVATYAWAPLEVETLARYEMGDLLTVDHSYTPEAIEIEINPADPDKTVEEVHEQVIEESDLSEYKDLLQGQIHVESRYDCNAKSFMDALGCAQFMPRTWEDVAPQVGCEGVSRTDPECSFLGQINYMAQQMAWTKGADLDSAFGMYNEGVGNFWKRQDACRAIPGCNPMVWEAGLKLVCIKSERACQESERYVGAIHKAAQIFRDRRVEFEVRW